MYLCGMTHVLGPLPVGPAARTAAALQPLMSGGCRRLTPSAVAIAACRHRLPAGLKRVVSPSDLLSAAPNTLHLGPAWPPTCPKQNVVVKAKNLLSCSVRQKSPPGAGCARHAAPARPAGPPTWPAPPQAAAPAPPPAAPRSATAPALLLPLLSPVRAAHPMYSLNFEFEIVTNFSIKSQKWYE